MFVLIKLIDQFEPEEAYRKYLEELRWPDGVKCPRCVNDNISRISKRNQFDCNKYRYQLSVTVGTIFQDIHFRFWKWFITVYLMVESKKGIAAL